MRLYAIAAVALLVLPATTHATHPESEGACPEHERIVGDESVGIQSEGGIEGVVEAVVFDWTNPRTVVSAGVVYYTWDTHIGEFIFSMWIYQESNGVAGLQRDDNYCYSPGYDTTTSDTIIF